VSFAIAGKVLLVSALAFVTICEVRTNKLEALFFSRYVQDITWTLQPGASDEIAFPTHGPFDITQGYTLLPVFQERLVENGYTIDKQARQSAKSRSLIEHGIAIPYVKTLSTGLAITDQHGGQIFQASLHAQRFSSFEAIPPLLIQLLLFRENRELFDAERPFLNPAVEWDRFALACLTSLGEQLCGLSEGVGGSTLATQIVKFRHSDEGRTKEPADKIKQMIGASLWSYRQGPNTMAVRKDIVRDYLNEMPLGAAPGYGAINGLGTGMWSWFGKDLRQVAADFALDESKPDDRQKKAATVKEVLALIISTQRPGTYLAGDLKILEAKVNAYLAGLAKAGIITPSLYATAVRIPLQFGQGAPLAPPRSHMERKGTDAIRTRLMDMLGVETLYELDRLDLTVDTTLDQVSQKNVNSVLHSLYNQQFLSENGFLTPYLLCKGDPAQLIYSVALFESRPDGNLCRVQADSLNRPLNINLGARLELGSTAKLRALCSFLMAIDEAARQAEDSVPVSTKVSTPRDPLTQWVIDFYRTHPGASREELLAASMKRTYSGSPFPGFFTGGGFHIFQNFKKEQDSQVFTLEEGFRESVNLVFIRLMREVVEYHIAKMGYDQEQILADTRSPHRQALLAEAADSESREFLRKFYRDHATKTPEERFARLAKSTRHPYRNWIILYFKEHPDAKWEKVLNDARPWFGADLDVDILAKCYKAYRGKSYKLTDEAYLLDKHPLEVWVAAYLNDHPHATWKETVEASAEARQAASAWLFKNRFRSAQNSRIRTLLERKAFEQIHLTWRSLGYPFQSLVPSLATAIGSSADRPANLAELIGIIVNDGIYKPTVLIQALHFAAGTPYETHFVKKPEPPKQAMSAEVAHTLCNALRIVVAEGTGRRIKDTFVNASGTPLDIGGKTGTGDNRFRTFRHGAEQVSSRSVSRTSTFVFFVDRFFGVVTAHVEGAQAAGYEFTSALAVQVLKTARPALVGLLPEANLQAEAVSIPAASSAPVFPSPARPLIHQVTPVESRSTDLRIPKLMLGNEQ